MLQGVFNALLTGASNIEAKIAASISKVMGAAVLPGDNLTVRPHPPPRAQRLHTGSAPLVLTT